MTLLLTPEEVGKELRMGRTRVYELLASGELPSVRLGRSRRITRDALAEYVLRLVIDQKSPAA